MITLNLDWREVLWWMQGGMAGSHLRWNVYEDMVNKVWPQCSEQERRNMWLIMRRDLGTYWRPDGWSGFDLINAKGEGEWREDIFDKTPWEYFRKVLARFDPENQFAVTMRVHNQKDLDETLRNRHMGFLIDWPKLSHVRGVDWESDTATVTVRTYKWGEDHFIDWYRRCDPDRFTKTERLVIPDTGEM